MTVVNGVDDLSEFYTGVFLAQLAMFGDVIYTETINSTSLQALHYTPRLCFSLRDTLEI